MRELYKVFRESSHTEFTDIYNKRISFESTIKLGLTIKPIDQPNTFELYYIPTNEMLKKISQIHKISNELNNTFDRLPNVAKEQFIFERIVDELYNTNELEGVRSTKDEIARSVKEVNMNFNTKKRFHSMIKSYQRLINGDVNLPIKPEDIRYIYDEITKEEIDSNELPDGDYFRKDITYVLKKSGSGKVIHRGVIPEKQIYNKLEHLLIFMNELPDIPLLIKVAIGHYFFGYIHPFYDGNGRTSRFISSVYLSEIIGHIGSLSFSQGCNVFTQKYLNSFEVTNSIMNRGEMNYFIIVFLDIILDTLKNMLTELKEKVELLRMAYETIENEQKLKDQSDNHKDLMFVLAQHHFFSPSKGLSVKELSNIFQLSTSTIRNMLNDLIKRSLIGKEGIRPATYFIKNQYFES